MPTARDELATLVGFRSIADPRRRRRSSAPGRRKWVADAFGRSASSTWSSWRRPTDRRPSSGTIGPDGAPTVLLYSHYDIQPAGDEALWHSPPFELTERGGRWYGRGAADCKGNVVMHLLALRALSSVADTFPVGIRIVSEGSEETGTVVSSNWCRTVPTCSPPTSS